MAVPLKQAVDNAVAFAANVLENRAKDLQLEEVESGEHNGMGAWQVTLSMIRPFPLDLPGFNVRPRDYKMFTVRKDTGEVTAMKIREFAGDPEAL